MGKEWWKSKTLWVNGLTFVGALLSFAAGHEVIAQYPAVASGILTVVAAVNIALRFLTNEPIEVK